MKRKKMFMTLGILLAAGLLLQTAILAYSGIFGDSGSDNIDISEVIVSQEIQELIKQQDPSCFDKNIVNYKRMVVVLDVHDKFKDEIERLIKQGKKVTDLMTAYSFLNDCYGTIGQLERLVDERESGKNWVDVFTDYNRETPAFVPRNFDFDYLENLEKTDGITSDDVMTADRVSQSTGTPFEDLIAAKASLKTWKEINAEIGVVNGRERILRVPVTSEQLKKYTAGGALSENRVVETLVTAFKLGLDEEEAINKAKAGYTTERFFAEMLERKYN